MVTTEQALVPAGVPGRLPHVTASSSTALAAGSAHAASAVCDCDLTAPSRASFLPPGSQIRGGPVPFQGDAQQILLPHPLRLCHGDRQAEGAGGGGQGAPGERMRSPAPQSRHQVSTCAAPPHRTVSRWAHAQPPNGGAPGERMRSPPTDGARGERMRSPAPHRRGRGSRRGRGTWLPLGRLRREGLHTFQAGQKERDWECSSSAQCLSSKPKSRVRVPVWGGKCLELSVGVPAWHPALRAEVGESVLFPVQPG